MIPGDACLLIMRALGMLDSILKEPELEPAHKHVHTAYAALNDAWDALVDAEGAQQ